MSSRTKKYNKRKHFVFNVLSITSALMLQAILKRTVYLTNVGYIYWKENLVKYRIQTMEDRLVISCLAIHPLYMGGIVSCLLVLPLFQDISLT